MLNKSYIYNPTPPRVWSRVQNPCTYIAPNSDYTQSFVPLDDQETLQANADKEMKMYYKGNILQYKGNSARLTKSQKYAQLARCAGPNRTKVFATQSETYTNPNTTGLLRSGYNTYPYPNQIVGAPNNISGPFAYNVPNPNDCSNNSVQDGGILVCGTYANPCTGEIYKKGTNTATICNESSASNVPGAEILCWNQKIQTWFPKPRYFMNNSTDKWPQGYKGFVSAIKSTPPILSANLSGNCGNKTITLSWTSQNNDCLPITGYNIFIDGKLLANVSTNVYTYNLNLPDGIYEVYITSLSGSNQSEPSNKIGLLIINDTETIIISYSNIKSTYYNEYGYTGVIVETTFTPTNPGYGEASFTTCKNLTNVSVLIVGGGGGGGGGYNSVIFTPSPSPFTAGAGGGGAGINYITDLPAPIDTPIYFKVGSGGKGGPANNEKYYETGSGGVTGLSSSLYITSTDSTFTSNGGIKGAGAGSASAGAGNGGSATVINGIATFKGYGGGGGGGAYSTGNTQPRKKGNGGAGYTNNGNPGTDGSSNLSGSGGDSNMYTYYLPFKNSYILVGGGGGGGGDEVGGNSGNGTGGNGGGNVGTKLNSGVSATNYGGGGGGGSQDYYEVGIPLNYGGNGGNGVIIVWWKN